MSRNNNLSGGSFAAGKPTPLTLKKTLLSAQIKEYLDNRGIYNDRLQWETISNAFGQSDARQ